MNILVTGATSDIGWQICKSITDQGHSVIMSDWSEEALLACQQQIGVDMCDILQLDLTDINNISATVVKYVNDKNIQINGIVFAAGIFKPTPLKLLDYAESKKEFDVSFFSAIEILKAVVGKKSYRENLKSVVFISSVSAKIGTKGYAIYGAIKSAILGFIKSAALELAPNARINAILPGGIRTKATEYIFNATNMSQLYPLGEGHPSNVADAVCFLLSDKASWITGQEMIVDGGLTV